MDLLEHPDAQPLREDAVRSCAGRLAAFAQRYLPLFARREQRPHAVVVLQGKLTGLQRKTTEPIARQARLDRRPLQLFVGAAKWDDRALVKRHGVEELLGQGKGEVGLGQYEVRSWVGWHHPMTLSLLALWFLQWERLRLGGKNAGGDGQSGAGGVHGTAAATGSERGADRGGGKRGSAA